MYNIKVYEKDGTTFKSTIQIEKFESISNFTAQVDGGFGKLKIGLAYKITDTSIEVSDIVKVQYKSDIIYTGSVLNINKLYFPKKEVIELNLVGYSSLLSFLMTNSTYSDIASDIVKDLIDDFNIEYGSNILSYDSNSIPDSTGTLNIDFSGYSNYFKAIQDVAETAGLNFFVDLDGKVYLDEKANFDSHTLTVGDNIDSISINEDSVNLVNHLTLKHGAGTTTYSDATSITKYGKREEYIDKSNELTNQATADEYGANYIATYKDEIKKVSIIVNSEYNFFNIKGGDLINVRNIGYTINNLQVAKIMYGTNTAKIDLEISYSFAKEIFL